MSILFVLLAGLSPPIPKGAFVPTVSVEEILDGYTMCLAVLQPSGLNRQALVNRGWSGIRVQDHTGRYLTAEPTVWQPPESFMFVSATSKRKRGSCLVTGRLADQAEVQRLIAQWPQPLFPGKKRSFRGLIDGRTVALTYEGTGQKPNVNVRMTRQMEPQ